MEKVKKIGVLLSFLSISTALAAVPVPYTLQEFLKNDTFLRLGLDQQNDIAYTKATFGTGFGVDPFGFGFDVNGYFPHSSAGQTRVDFTVRNASFLTKQHGIQWGRLSGITLGQGELMRNYDSGSGEVFAGLMPQKTGVHAYTQLGPVGLEGLYTARSLVGARVAYTQSNVVGHDVTLGGTYVNDPVGVSGNSGQSGFAVDLSTPLSGDLMVLYGEAVWLKDHGKGGGAGLKGNFLDLLTYQAGYRVLGSDYVPGYFGPVYEQSAPALGGQRREGVILGLGAALGELALANATWESYGNDQLLSGELGFKPILGVAAVIHYTQPFKGNTDPVLQAQAGFLALGPWQVIGDFRQVYHQNQTDTRYSIGLQTSLTRLMGLPF
jgi:hypothetical protein